MPSITDRYQEKLILIGIDVTENDGKNIYQSALNQFKVPDDRIGVPMLVVGDKVLVGDVEIPQQFPSLIDQGLANGGVQLPNIPGLDRNFLSSIKISTDRTLAERFMGDLAGNILAVIILVGMIVSVTLIMLAYIRGRGAVNLHWPAWIIPTLSVLGMVVAGYLTYVHASNTRAFCGPIGDCNAVQESTYASLFGVLPVAILGFVGYMDILAAWLVQVYGPPEWRKFAAGAIWFFAWIGVFFTVYLTFLEPFVIGASCVWCLASAVLITLILWASTPPTYAFLASKDPAEIPA
jgi:uncharacterized membrane protein